jgi:hypothetical protein
MLDAYLRFLEFFYRSSCDPLVYSQNDSRGLILVGIYVDDLTIAASDSSTLSQFKSLISAKFEMKDLGDLEYILGLQVRRNRAARTLHLSHECGSVVRPWLWKTVCFSCNTSDVNPLHQVQATEVTNDVPIWNTYSITGKGTIG